MKQLIPLLIMIILVSCGRIKQDKKQPSTKDSISDQTESEESYAQYKIKDSIKMAAVLKEAMEIASKNINAARFKNEFQSLPDSEYYVHTTVAFDNFFSASFKHLIIHMSQPGGDFFHVYKKEGDSFVQVISSEQFRASDTLQDVNGDGINDFLINWYGNTGCCLKNFYAVYLYQPQSGTFSAGYEFINPTFSAKEKVIRGVEYGHPGETSMYKYKWNGLQVDTLEYIYFEKNDDGTKTGKIIRKTNKEERLNQAPVEYKNIYGYDWFMGKV